MFHSIPPAAAKAVMLPALAVIFGEKQHEGMRAARHPRSGACFSVALGSQQCISCSVQQARGLRFHHLWQEPRSTSHHILP